jgi:ABC-type phosphate transport system substrate-binding protein
MTKRLSLVAAILILVPFRCLFAADGFKVIAHPSVTGEEISRGVLAGIFLKHNTRWSDDSPILVVDQSTRSPVREAFSKDVLHKSVAEIQYYWMRVISSGGETPPPVKGSDAEVAAYVRAHPGAVGYVSEGFAVADGLKLLRVGD